MAPCAVRLPPQTHHITYQPGHQSLSPRQDNLKHILRVYTTEHAEND